MATLMNSSFFVVKTSLLRNYSVKYTPVGGRQATPYRRLGFVGDALSITLRRGGLRPASRDHADQTSGTHYNTSLTLRETGAVSAPHHVTTLIRLLGLIIILLSLYERQPSQILPPHRLTRSSRSSAYSHRFVSYDHFDSIAKENRYGDHWRFPRLAIPLYRVFKTISPGAVDTLLRLTTFPYV